MRAVVLGASLLAALPGPVRAAPDGPLPQVVQAEIQESRKACDPGTAELGSRFAVRKDVNGDGIVDFVLDYTNFTCNGSPIFCGSAGCLAQVFASLPDGGYAKVLDENVEELRFRTGGGRVTMQLLLHGSACGQTGATPCRQTLYWNGSAFVRQ